jgi:hypothetical protein
MKGAGMEFGFWCNWLRLRGVFAEGCMDPIGGDGGERWFLFVFFSFQARSRAEVVMVDR